MKIPTIQIFAIDHDRGNNNLTQRSDAWNNGNLDYSLPYIHLTSPIRETSSEVFKSNISGPVSQRLDYEYSSKELEDIMSELPKIFYINDNLHHFGNPDYVGVCHYRRYFISHEEKRFLIINPNDVEDFILNKQNKICLSPSQILPICLKDDPDIIAGYPFRRTYPYKENTGPFKDCKTNFDRFRTEFLPKSPETYGLNSIEEFMDDIISTYKKYFPEKLQPYFDDAAAYPNEYWFNISIQKNEYFRIYSNMLKNTLIELYNKYKDNELLNNNFGDGKSYNKRWLGYFAERCTSIFINAIKLSGGKVVNVSTVWVR